MFVVLQNLGHEVIKIPFGGVNVPEGELKEALAKKLREKGGDILFSFNYFPNASNCCKELGLKYVAWVYDSPHIHAYSYTVLNSCNYIFLFDYAMYEELHNAGIQTVYYMPLAINEKRLASLHNSKEIQTKYASDISFVGSLYSEPKHRIYDKFQNIGGYARGYLDGLVKAQLHVQGYNFLQELLIPEVVEEMQKAYPTDPNASTVLSPEAIYADYVLARQVTAVERQTLLERIGKEYSVDLYTYDKDWKCQGIRNKGLVDYYDDMPYVFMNSKINLNITLRSIKTGIPLRAFDIMGSGGFLLTNYQQELFEYFVPDEDFVYYTDQQDLMNKIEYYLTHEEERQRIARNGCEKVRSQHTLEQRMQDILEIVHSDCRDTEQSNFRDDAKWNGDRGKLKVLFVRSNEIEMLGLADGFTRLGHDVTISDVQVDLHMTEPEDVMAVKKEIAKEECDLVVTYDFCPGVSKACNEMRVPYLSWVYDSPLAELYLREVRNSCNYICVFDRKQYERLAKEQRIAHLLYAPLASESQIFREVQIQEGDQQKYGGDVAFVGRLYNQEAWNALLEGATSDVYAEADELVHSSACKWDGQNRLFDKASDALIEQIASKLPPGVWDIYQWDKRYLCESLKIARRCNEIGRVAILGKLAQKYNVVLYSDGTVTEDIAKVEIRPWVDYWKEMPKVFKLSKINLNITSRSIESGISQRVWDIMAAGGFCLTNYQPEIEEYFEIGKEIEVYHDLEELEQKVAYYLTHEEERIRIAQNGFEKVHREHNYAIRLQEILKRLPL